LSEQALDDLNAELAQRLRAKGVVPSTTRVADKYAIRPCFINPCTTSVDVERAIARTRAIGDALTKDGRVSQTR
jgi:hypothetical protein